MFKHHMDRMKLIFMMNRSFKHSMQVNFLHFSLAAQRLNDVQ